MCQLPRRYLLGCGFLFVLYTAVVYLAVGLARNRDQVLEVALINYLWPATTIVFSLKLLNQRASLWLWPGTAFALAGVFLVMTHSAHASWHSFWDNLNSNPVVYLLALVAAVSWALYSNLARRWAAPGSDGAVELFIPITGLVLLGLRLGTVETTAWNARAVVETAALGSITAIAYVLWEMAMRKGNLLFVAACSYFTPLLSTLVSCVYLKVVPGSRLWIGCLLIVAGSLVSWRSVSDRPEAKPAADRVAPQIQ